MAWREDEKGHQQKRAVKVIETNLLFNFYFWVRKGHREGGSEGYVWVT